MTVKDKLVKMLNIKSIVTILTTIVFCCLTFMGQIPHEQFMSVFITIIAFYFGTQSEKNAKNE